MSMGERPTIYEILELDGKETNKNSILKKLEEQKRVWSKWKNQGAPKQKAKAEDYFGWLKEIEEVINNPELLKIERQKFLKLEKEKKESAYEALDKMIDFVGEKNIPDEVYKTFLKKMKGQLSQADIDARLKKKGYTVGKKKTSSKKSKSSKKPKLESSKAKEIANKVTQLGKKDLYDFLGLRQNSSIKKLQERALDIWKETQGKTDTQNSRKSELAGTAKDIFSSKEKKEMYDNTLSATNLTVLDHFLEIAGSDGILTDDEMTKLLKAAKENNINIDDARAYIEEKVEKRNWKIMGAETYVPPKLLTCGFCGELADDEKQKRCAKCGEELIQPCPICKNPTPTEQAACSKCGCTTGDAPEIYSMMKKVEIFSRDKKFSEAKKTLHSVLALWYKWDVATKRLNEIEMLEKKQKKAYQSVVDAMAKRHYVQASRLVNDYIQEFGKNGLTKLQSEIELNLKKAKQFFLEAEKHKTAKEYEKAIALYDNALTIVSDYDSARNALSKMPIPLPENFTGKIVSGRVNLSWKTSGNEKISYTIIRKENTIPKNVDDGKAVTKELYGISAVDHTLEEGKIYYYGIFPVRNGVASQTGKNIGPYMIPGDVKVEYKAGDKRVELIWSSPANVASVEVWKKEGKGPIKRGEGIKLSAGKNSLIDNDVVNEKAYTYLVVARYRDPLKDGQYLHAPGVTVLATPTAPPKEIKDLRAEIKDSKVFLTWTSVNDSVQIRQVDKKPPLQAGEIISLQSVEKIGTPVTVTSSNKAQATIGSQGNIYFLPLTIKHQTVVVGEPVKITTIKDVENLQSHQIGQKIILTFTPPVGAKSFWVSCRYDRFTKKPNESGTINKKYTIGEYRKNKQLEIEIDQNKKHFITVYTYDEKDHLYSGGRETLESCGNQELVKYHVATEKSFFLRKVENVYVSLSSRTSNMILQDIVVVFKSTAVPLTIDDGETIKNMKKVSFEEGRAKINIPQKYWNQKGYIKLFFKNKNDSRQVRLMPAAEDKLQIR